MDWMRTNIFFHKQEILNDDNKNTLEDKLTSLAIKNIEKDLSDIYLDKIVPIKQGSKNISYCKKIDKLSGRITLIRKKVILL